MLEMSRVGGFKSVVPASLSLPFLDFSDFFSGASLFTHVGLILKPFPPRGEIWISSPVGAIFQFFTHVST